MATSKRQTLEMTDIQVYEPGYEVLSNTITRPQSDAYDDVHDAGTNNYEALQKPANEEVYAKLGDSKKAGKKIDYRRLALYGFLSLSVLLNVVLVVAFIVATSEYCACHCRNQAPSLVLNFHPNFNLTGLNITCLSRYRDKAVNLISNLRAEMVGLIDSACGRDKVYVYQVSTGLFNQSAIPMNPFEISLKFKSTGLSFSKLAPCVGGIIQPIHERINLILGGLHNLSHYLNCPAITTAPVNVTQDLQCEHTRTPEYNRRIGWCDRATGPNRNCWSEPCYNGGSCIDNPAGQNGLTCVCRPEFTGLKCQTPITTDPELRFQLSHRITWSDPLNSTCTIQYVKKSKEFLTQYQNIVINFISASCNYTLQPGFEVQFNMSQSAGEMIVFSGILTPTKNDTNLTLFDNCMATVAATASSFMNTMLSGASTPGCPALQLAPGDQLVARPSWSCAVGSFVYNGNSRSCEIN